MQVHNNVIPLEYEVDSSIPDHAKAQGVLMSHVCRSISCARLHDCTESCIPVSHYKDDF